MFTSKEETLKFSATFETTGSGLREDTDLFENVDSGNEVSFTAANHTPSGSKVYRMNQSNPSGPGIMLRVYPGDTVEPSVYAYHENSSGYGTNSAGLSSMIAAIAGAFGGQSGGSEGQQAIFDAFDDALTVLGLGGNQGDDRPAAYLNYLFFDETNGFDYQNQDDDYGWKEVPAGAYYSKALVQLDSAIKIKVPGYLYIYLSYENESNNYVYFDDLKINYQKSQIVQSNNYYAFGLQTKDSWTRMDTKPNQYLYNAGSELNEATSSYDMMFRSYDPAIGRMSGVDPMVNSFASLSPYNYSFNDPVYWNDPSGASPWDDSPYAGQRKFGPESGNKYEDCSCGGSNDMYGNGGFTGVGTYYFGGLMFVVDWGNGTTTVDAGMDSGFTPVTYFSNDMAIVTDSRIVYEDLFSSLDTWNEGAGSVWRSNRGSSSHYRALSNEVTQAVHSAGQAFAENPFGAGLLAFVSSGGLMGGGGLVGKAALSSRVMSTLVDAGSQLTVSLVSGNSLKSSIGQINITSLSLSLASPSMKFNTMVRNGMLSSAFATTLNGNSLNIVNGGRSVTDVLISGGINGIFSGLNSASRSVAAASLWSGRSLLSNGFSPATTAYRATVYTWASSKGISIISGGMADIASDLYGNGN